MKKFLTVISLLLVMTMLASLPVYAEGEKAANSKLVTYKANLSTNVPIVDGIIEEGEYGQKIATSSDPVPMAGSLMDKVADEPATPYLRTGSFDLYVSADKDNIYLAFEEIGGVWDGEDAGNTEGDSFDEHNIRCNYKLRFGFVPEDLTEFLQIGGFNTKNTGIDGWNTTYYSGFGGPGNASTPLADNVSEWVTEFAFAKYKMADDSIISVGGLFDMNGNSNSNDGQYRAVCELKIEKAALIQLLDEYCGIVYEQLPTTMYFCIGTNPFKWINDTKTVDSARNNTIFFAANVKGEQTNYADYGMTESTKQEWLPCVIELPEFEYVATEPATTEAPTDAPVTNAPDATDAPETTAAPADSAAQTDAPTTEAPAEGGCGASISVAGMALVAALGMGVTVVSKKRR